MIPVLRGIAACLIAAPCLASCVHAPTAPPRATLMTALPGHALADGPSVSAEAPPSQWWRLYRDPALDAFVEEALANNRDLRVAAARLLEAQAALRETQGERAPATDLSAGIGYGSMVQDQIAAAATGSEHVRTGPRFDVGAGLSWEVDLFGRLRSAVKAVRANVEATTAERDGTRILIAAGVTDAWLRACSFAHRAEVAREAMALTQRGRDLAQRLRQAGAGLPLDVLRADALHARARAAVPDLDAGRHNALAELAVLAGRLPGSPPEAAAACNRVPTLAVAQLPAGDGMALLRRRPDVRAAESRLAARTARIGIAVADLYPHVALGGGLAMSSPTVSGLPEANNHVWRAGPLLSWTFPNLSAARARIAQARADEAAALASFDAAILTAFKEVNQAAETYRAALDRQRQLTWAADQSAGADRLVRARRTAGGAAALEMLDADRADIDARAALAAADADVAAAQITLFKALGGGWEEAPAITLPSPDRPITTFSK